MNSFHSPLRGLPWSQGGEPMAVVLAPSRAGDDLAKRIGNPPP